MFCKFAKLKKKLMGFIEDELSEVRKLCEHVVPNSRLVSCVRTMVRAELRKTEFKTIIVCIQFADDYPNSTLLLELKSKTLSEKLLQGLSNVCEQELKKYLGKAQVLNLIKFLHNFLEETPLCCCYNEINALKQTLSGQDELKLKQKSSSLILKVYNNNYYLNCRIIVPDKYPLTGINIEDVNTNFSPAFHRHMVGQAKEIGRKCVEPPVKQKSNQPPFKPGPSLQKTVEFLIDCVKRIPQEQCQFCGKMCFPQDPKFLEADENSPKHVERVYCGHLFHQECFFTFMKAPPFGNKSCKSCGQKIHHFKWSLTDKLAEDRWAHAQARDRELQEVTEFFN